MFLSNTELSESKMAAAINVNTQYVIEHASAYTVCKPCELNKLKNKERANFHFGVYKKGL